MDIVVGEDDPRQRAQVVRLIEKLRPDWRLVALADSARAVAEAVAAHQPQLLVLDVHMPGDAGTGWIRELPCDRAVIFTTGDPSFAVEAFQMAAVDYVLKPLTEARVELAFTRAEARLGLRALPPATPSNATGVTGSEPLATLVAARGSDLILFQASDICYLQADNKYTRIVSAEQEGLVRTTIGEFERRLDPRFFKRIHRSTLLNLRMAQRIWRDDLGRLRVRIPGPGSDLHVSRPFEHLFRVL